MKRAVWGTILSSLGLLFVASAGNNPQGPAGSLVMGAVCLVVGALLLYVGIRSAKLERAAAECSLQMLREDGKIDVAAIRRRLGVGEVDVRRSIVAAQGRGIIPFKAEIL